MAESTASLESQYHGPKPVAKPRRIRSKSAIQSPVNCSEQVNDDQRSPLQENTKPERPSVPPRPNFSEIKKQLASTRTPHSSSTVTHNQVSQPSSPKQRRILTSENHNHIKSPGSPRSLTGSSSANDLAHQRKSEQLQRIRSKSNSECVHSGRSNGSLKQQQKKVSDSGLQGSKSVSTAARVSHSKSFSSPERKRKAINIASSTGRANAQQQSPTRPTKPPIPANRPSIAPCSSATSSNYKGSTPSGPSKQNQRPSRPPTLPKTAITLTSSKTAPLSHLYGSTQSLPAVTDGSRKVTTTPKCADNGAERPIKVSPNKEPPQRYFRTLPKDYGRKSATQKSNRLQPVSRKPSGTQQTQGKRALSASVSVGMTSTKPLRGLAEDSQNSQSTVLARKTQPQHSKTPPRRPPPVVRDKPRPAMVTKTLHNTPPSVDNSTSSDPRYTTFTSRTQHQQQCVQPIEDHIYMDPHQTDVSSWPMDGGAEYPYVIMSRVDHDFAHIYTALALDTTDDLEDYDNVILGSDLQESPVVSVTGCSELDRDENHSVQHTMNNEDVHLQDYENARTSLASTVPEPERSEFNDECLQSQEGDGPSLDRQTTEKEDAPTTECVMTAEEDGQLAIAADEQTEEVSFSHPDQEMYVDSEGMCSNQQSDTHDRLEGEDNQQSITQLQGQDSQPSVTQLELQDSQLQSSATQLELQEVQQSSATQLEHQESQQSAEHQERHLECFKTAEESDKELSKEGYSEEFQENKSNQNLNDTTNEEAGGGSTTSPLVVAAEDHTALSEDHYQKPRIAARVLKVRVELVEETETEEECQQQSKSNQPSSINSPMESDRQTAAEYSVPTINGDTNLREVMNPATPTTQAPDSTSPIDQDSELSEYYNVDAINMHSDGLIV